MKLPKYNLDYNTRDLMNTLAKIASDRKCDILILFFWLLHTCELRLQVRQSRRTQTSWRYVYFPMFIQSKCTSLSVKVLYLDLNYYLSTQIP